jgi:Predicted acyltransferases
VPEPRRHDPAGSRVRPEIQALRALAVLLVLGYHFWPNRVPGGYVGVDVFFVISGFLITAHLLREAETTGRIRLAAFWARRARRLLPASLLVLAATAVAVYLVAPIGVWQRFFQEIAAAGLYVENLLLAVNSVDYLASHDPSPVQHFWSLSVEEQFYLVWPLLIALALVVSRRRPVSRRTIFVVLAVVTVASLVVSIVVTEWASAPAYFLPFTRAWQFGAGALLAFAPALPARAPAAVLGWAGLAAILASAMLYSAATPFPGFAASLPVVGALAVIAGGPGRGPWSVTELSDWRPIQWIGDISYSLYLWHWPLLILLPFALGHPLGTRWLLLTLAATFVLAALSKRFVEDPFRRPAGLARRAPLWTFGAVAGGMAVLVATCVVGFVVGRPVLPVPPVVPAVASCYGAGATVEGADCELDPIEDWAGVAAFARIDRNDAGEGDGWENCETGAGTVELRNCILGNFDDPVRTVALVGDSHASQMDGALFTIAQERHWNVITFVRSACAATGDESVYFPQREFDQAACAEWGRGVAEAIIDDERIDAVFMAGYAGTYRQTPDSRLLETRPYLDLWDRFTAAGKRVYVFSDTPRPIGDVPTCLETRKSIVDCSAPRSTNLYPNVMLAAAAESENPDVHVIDLTDRYCLGDTCPPVIGNIVVYADDSHLTKSYSKTLAPFISRVIDEAEGSR